MLAEREGILAGRKARQTGFDHDDGLVMLAQPAEDRAVVTAAPLAQAGDAVQSSDQLTA